MLAQPWEADMVATIDSDKGLSAGNPWAFRALFGSGIQANLIWERMPGALREIWQTQSSPRELASGICARGVSILVGKEESFHKLSAAVAERIADGLGIEDHGVWAWQLPLILGRLQSLFSNDWSGPGAVLIVPWRNPIRERLEQKGVRLEHQLKNLSKLSSEKELKCARVSLGFGLGQLDAEEKESLVFSHLAGMPQREVSLFSLSRTLVLSGTNLIQGMQTVLFVAHPSAHQGYLSSGDNPAIQQYREATVFKTGHVILAILDSCGDILELSLDFSDGEGRTVEITSGLRSLGGFRLDRGTLIESSFGGVRG
jgi:hypothetical protein